LAEYGSPDNWLNAVITKKEYLEKENRLNDLVLNSLIVSYPNTLNHPEEHAHYFYCPSNVNILDKAQEQGISLPYSCCAVACSSYAARMIAGQVDQSDQTFLNDAHIAAGYVLLCVAGPMADSGFRTWVEEELYQ